jgi:hypothetical protein
MEQLEAHGLKIMKLSGNSFTFHIAARKKRLIEKIIAEDADSLG